MELAELLAQTQAAILGKINLPDFQPCKVSMWLKFVRIEESDGAKVEQNAGPVQKLVFTAGSPEELVHQVTENMLLTVYGAEVQIVKDLPNLIVKLFDKKAYVPVAGAPPLDQPGQIYLKATVYRFEPSLWDQLFGRAPAGE